MEKQQNPARSGRKVTLVLAGVVLAAVVVIYFAFLYPPTSDENLRGTIGGVEKAERYRAEQIGEADVVLQDPEIQDLLQRDDFQRLIASDDFRKLLARSDVRELLANR